mmetsp:Transcript_24278/g.51606  ORF Transcript_24278/g.51606 Transcript_24278/m.51606 type:complete len:236 (+) Transcript_24278:203-910(+)|eukprot:CAMPEP_0201124086 /NCGR_PEP_ID=MMETSP0850-20130426/10508_1 /ASSEMBLY_ACC=CAM_ASM_000622 /TAXON_ID=183588 /ORGANISM="Pseudo-nitzschia fraudulenta, Strain WWA7" /LENGTH=235 /DNA_ID=CAMNT_0047391275 /DNA_START=195 /DNA_END=902 /DNA_ORIENTATION=+
MADDNFFGEPTSADAVVPPAAEDGGFTLLGEAETPAAFVGDVQDDGMGFAAAPAGDEAEMMGFAAAPEVLDDNAPILLGAPPPPVEDAPIVLGPPSAVEDIAETAAPVESAAIVPEEPSAMKKWNEEHKATLAARKKEEDDAKAAMVEAARVAMEEFQTKASMKRDAKMAKNREDEQAKLEDIEADLENDNSWQRVSKMVDLTQDGAEDGEDTKRMRDIFILLKNEQGLAAKVGA